MCDSLWNSKPQTWMKLHSLWIKQTQTFKRMLLVCIRTHGCASASESVLTGGIEEQNLKSRQQPVSWSVFKPVFNLRCHGCVSRYSVQILRANLRYSCKTQWLNICVVTDKRPVCSRELWIAAIRPQKTVNRHWPPEFNSKFKPRTLKQKLSHWGRYAVSGVAFLGCTETWVLLKFSVWK